MERTVVTPEQVDQLAVQFVLTEDSEQDRANWRAALLALLQQASEAGQQEAILAVRNLLALADAASENGFQRAQLEDGINSLRQAVIEYKVNADPVEPPAATTNASLAQDAELIADFVLESREHLEAIEGQLLALEQNVEDLEPVHSIFRSFHTIKGIAGFLELSTIQSVAHEVETLLDMAREARLKVTPDVIDVVLESKDFMARWLQYLESATGSAPPPELTNHEHLLRRVKQLITEPLSETESRLPLVSGETRLGGPSVPAVASNDAIGPYVKATGTGASAPEAGEGLTVAPKPDQKPQQEARKGAASVKVDTDKLDYLVDMVGELVVAQSLVRHDPDVNGAQNPRLTRNLAQLSRITSELQRTAMLMRMVPIGPLFQKMARLVRDLSRKFGKQIAFAVSGEDVQLDRNIVEALGDPLMHMVRNAVDHGVDTPEERLLAGKTAEATIHLRAFHRSGRIVIEVSDNGRGLNREKILRKAVANELIGATANLTDTECFNLIFHPGFSTAEEISNVSGRGVGMDVVRKQIQKLRGQIEIESAPGQGTTFSLHLPLTLAIIDGLVVRVGEQRYILPIAAVREVIRPTAGMVFSVENRAEVLTIRESFLPILRLYKRFNLQSNATNAEDGVFVVIEADGRPFCLMVDELLGKQEVVIKSLGPVFQGVRGLAGGAILGDGQVGLILDAQSLHGEIADA